MSRPLEILPDRVEGEGLVLRRWLVSDADALGRAILESEDHLRPWMAWMSQEPLTLSQRQSMLFEREREWARGEDVMLGIFTGDQIAGSCGLHRRGAPDSLEIGYWVHPAFARQGIATTAARLLTDAALLLPGITQVEIRHDRMNAASACVPRKLGFVYAGESPDEIFAPAEVGVSCVWRMDRDRWRELRAAPP